MPVENRTCVRLREYFEEDRRGFSRKNGTFFSKRVRTSVRPTVSPIISWIGDTTNCDTIVCRTLCMGLITTRSHNVRRTDLSIYFGNSEHGRPEGPELMRAQ